MIHFAMGKKQAILGLLALLLIFVCFSSDSDTFTLSTYYPAPYGIYTNLTTANLATRKKTSLAVNALPEGAVGIGTDAPAPNFKLDVRGNAVINGDLSITGNFNPSSTGAAIYKINAGCPSGGALTDQPNCSTTACGGVDTYRGCACYYTCDGACRFYVGPDTGCNQCGGGATCSNALIGHPLQ